MLESELYDRESHDNAAGGRGAGELSSSPPSVPAAMFQPPQVLFQPPAVRTEPVSQPEAPRPASSSGGSEPPGEAGGDDDGTGPRRTRRRRPSRSRARTGDQDAAESGGDAAQA